MKLKKRLPVLLMLAALMIFNINLVVSAHDVPDMDTQGSISVSVQYDGKAVPGGTLTLYRAGDVTQDDGNYDFTLNKDFAGSRVSLEDIQSDQTAKALASYAEAQDISGETRTISEDGKVVFQDLELGLYLLVQHEAADDFVEMAPFLIGIPMVEDGTYIYDVDASPKTETEKAPVQPEEPDQPKTGQNEETAPYAVAAGLSLCAVGAVGCMIYARRKHSRHGN